MSAAIVTCPVAVDDSPSTLVTVSEIVYVPGVSYTWLALNPVSESWTPLASPKSQAKLASMSDPAPTTEFSPRTTTPLPVMAAGSITCSTAWGFVPPAAAAE